LEKESTLFEVLQARVEHAFDPVELTVPGFLHLVEAAVDVIEAHVHVRSEIAQAGTIDQYPDQNRDHGRHGRERNGQDLRVRHGRFLALRRSATRTKERKASFTDFESGKALATSGSSDTTFVASAYRFAYLPTTPPLKSYSFRMGGLDLFLGTLFMLTPLLPGCYPGTDEPDSTSSLSMNHHE